MSRLYPTNFAFEVDLEKMEGRFLFDTRESDQKLAEKKLLECCSYNNIISAGSRQKSELLEIDSSEVLGLTLKGAILPMGDTITTQLETEKGFICQVNPYFWGESIYCGGTIYILTMDKEYPIKVVNSFFDI